MGDTSKFEGGLATWVQRCRLLLKSKDSSEPIGCLWRDCECSFANTMKPAGCDVVVGQLARDTPRLEPLEREHSARSGSDQ